MKDLDCLIYDLIVVGPITHHPVIRHTDPELIHIHFYMFLPLYCEELSPT